MSKKQTDEHHVLNLDELFGTARPVKVTWQGKEYELVRPEGLNAVQHQAFSRLYTKIQKAQLDLGNDPDELEAMVNELIALLNARLADAGLAYMAKIKVLEFYAAEVFEPEKGKTAAKNPPIGA